MKIPTRRSYKPLHYKQTRHRSMPYLSALARRLGKSKEMAVAGAPHGPRAASRRRPRAPPNTPRSVQSARRVTSRLCCDVVCQDPHFNA
ncbi:hypothetical protein EVAR_83190_1 [Eumeta japonica]|uniref:Uncharacterized protein n=1 Tax=Eumeta variegata TaxID=151549 RepID=A0A4C1YSV3_EUMVA|nr:hypothetical protein EVAR_83190_1 [Eumeta japonica]